MSGYLPTMARRKYPPRPGIVIERHVDNRGEEMVRLRGAVGHIGTGVDVLVYSEAEVEERRDWCTSPIYWALREGRTLYDAQ